MKPYYQDKAVAIYHGDCREILPSLPDVDLVLTDIPYNVGCNYLSYNDVKQIDEYDAWINSWWMILTARMHIRRKIIFPGVGNLGLWYERMPVAYGCWYKPGSPGKANPFQFNEWEPILFWGVCFSGSDVFKASVSKQKGIGCHPCPKPLKLFKDLIVRERFSKGIILDPFMGSGTTLRAAKDLGRKAIGIEIEEKYCEIAARRMRQEVIFQEALEKAEEEG